MENIAKTMINYDAMEPFIIGLKIVQGITFLCTYPPEKKILRVVIMSIKGCQIVQVVVENSKILSKKSFIWSFARRIVCDMDDVELSSNF